MYSNLAPVGISVYGRISHLKETVNALKKNILAKDSEVYFFSDAPLAGDEKIVLNIRAYIRSIKGFKKTHLIERKENNRVKNNRGGMKFLLEKYGKLIWLEEDIVTAPGFLTFMNEALDFYKSDGDILSISGYAPPIIPQPLLKDVFVLKRFTAWGFATWKNKFDPFNFAITNQDFEKVIFDKRRVTDFAKHGKDMLPMVMADYNKKIDALDVKIMFYQYLHDKYTVYPSLSLVQNIGHDGSGVHCGVTTKFYINKLWEKKESFKFIISPSLDEEVVKANFKFRQPKLKYRVINFLKFIIYKYFIRTILRFKS